MKQTVITSYIDPDLDGTACAMAYAELLTKQNQSAIAALFGNLHKEALFVLKTFAIKKPRQAERLIRSEDDVILVDASDTKGISSQIKRDQVVEIIDHRAVNEIDQFPNAQVDIQLVGSCATLIAERFKKVLIAPSSDSAALLYSAIISNTVNFQANVTTDRDHAMANWLISYFDCPENYIHDMFVAKSAIEGSVKDAIEHDFALIEINSKRIGIAQLEIIDVAGFVKKHRSEITAILGQLKEEYKLDYVFFSGIDVERITNTFLVLDDRTQDLLKKVLTIAFQDNSAVRPGIMMRKTITPLLKQSLG